MNDPRFRALLWQTILLVVLVVLVGTAGMNALENMRAHNIPTGFGFLGDTAGFDINQALIPFRAGQSTFARAFLVGLLNTLLVCGVSLFFATLVGFVVGIARLSKSWPVAKLAALYVETIRNLPLPLQLLFWYNAILTPLPNPRQALTFGGVVFLHNRGMSVPAPVFGPGSLWIAVALVVAIAASVLFGLRARRHLDETGRRLPVWPVTVALVVAMPLGTSFLLGHPVHFDVPQLRGFNFIGGWRLLPEFVALALGLSLYTASFIAEVVRGGVLAVRQGQVEAAQALGLSATDTRRLVVLPQAMRVIVPPLTNQYLNLIKNSSLAVFVGYPDLVQVFGDKVREQSTASVQTVLITMGVFLAISLITSGLMALYNRRIALVER